MKNPIGVGALKPNKVKSRKTTAKVCGHMPVGAGGFGRKQGKPNKFSGKTKGQVLG